MSSTTRQSSRDGHAGNHDYIPQELTMARPSAQPEARSLTISDCHPNCSFYPDKLGTQADAVHRIFEAGGTQRHIAEVLAGIGITTTQASVGRHRQHLTVTDPDDIDEPGTPTKTIPTMDFVDAVISSSFRARKNWRPSIRDGLDALKLRIELNGGAEGPMAALMEALASAADPEEEIPSHPDTDLNADHVGPESEGYE